MSELGRREFFSRLVRRAGSALSDTNLPSLAALTFPRRLLGQTGESVPVLGLGTASLGRGVADDKAAMLLNRAVDLGVNYIDTAPDIGGYGRAQLQIGRALSARRQEIFLATKLFQADADDAWRLLERNLQELGTDHVDVLYAHSIGDDRMDPETMFSQHGVFATLMRAKAEGMTRYVGATAHSRPERMVRALAEFDIDVIMTAVNFGDVHTYGFEETVWPFARRKGVGVVAMKVYGGIRGSGHTPSLMDEADQEMALRYALSLESCATAVVGMISMAELDENIRRARAFTILSAEERGVLAERGRALAREWGEHLGPAN